MQYANVNEPGLFDTCDHIDNHARFVSRSVNEDISVLGFSNGTRRNGNDIGIVNRGDLH